MERMASEDLLADFDQLFTELTLGFAARGSVVDNVAPASTWR
jgi:hypothetical protein